MQFTSTSLFVCHFRLLFYSTAMGDCFVFCSIVQKFAPFVWCYFLYWFCFLKCSVQSQYPVTKFSCQKIPPFQRDDSAFILLWYFFLPRIFFTSHKCIVIASNPNRYCRFSWKLEDFYTASVVQISRTKYNRRPRSYMKAVWTFVIFIRVHDARRPTIS